jgi:hypothetical protein
MGVAQRLIGRIRDWWNPPCPKHPGHRMNEIDAEVLTGCAMVPSMCSLCWEEFERQNRWGGE